MGILRFLLALSVLLVHASPHRNFLVDGRVAVQIFYCISGFYMALILNEKYVGPGSYRLFLSNRLLRLFPAYAVILVATVVFETHAVPQFEAAAAWSQHRPDAPASVVLTAANALLVGQDWITFAAVSPWGSLYFTPNFRHEAIPAHSYLFVPQAWTLGLELTFYLIAPFILRRSARVIAAIVIASFAVRMLTYSVGLREDPWNYRFFPCELGIFLLGSLAYRAYRKYGERIRSWPYLKAAPVAAAALLCSFPFAAAAGPPMEEARDLAYVLLFAACLPVLFAATRSSKVDRIIGDLSYPIYISHILVLYICMKTGHLNTPAVLLGTLVIASALRWGVEVPVDRFRQHLAKRVQAS